MLVQYILRMKTLHYSIIAGISTAAILAGALLFSYELSKPMCIEGRLANGTCAGPISIEETSDTLSNRYCKNFFTVPENKTYLNTVPVLLMKSNSTACARLTFTVSSNYNDCNGPNCQHVISLGPML